MASHLGYTYTTPPHFCNTTTNTPSPYHHHHITITNPNAVTAMPILPSDKLLVHLPGPAPPGWLDAVAARFPQLTVRWELAALDAAASDLARADTLPAETLAGVTLLCVYPPPRARAVPDVRWVQLVSAGSDRWRGHDVYEDPRVVFCSGSGCQPCVSSPSSAAVWTHV